MTTVYRLVHELALASHPEPLLPKGVAARWNSEGVQVAYASESLALAAMELLSYWGQYDSMHGYSYFSTGLDGSDVEDLWAVTPELDPRELGQTRAFGDAWAREQRSLALRVPSVVLPHSWNYLINPRHPRFSSLTVKAHGAFAYDQRVRDLVVAARARR